MRVNDRLRRLMVGPATTLRRTMEIMTGPPASAMVLVTDKRGALLGLVVDTDLRKAMLRGYGLDTPISKVMNPRPFTLPDTLGRDAVAEQFRRTPRACFPLVDKARRVKAIAEISDYLAVDTERPNWVVLLVGGLGRRLHPLTQNQPKPLLPVGNKPILEIIIEQFMTAGFRNFVLAVNHQADQIRKHFGDGSRLGADVRYVQEDKALGTAGPLSLLSGPFRDPLIVMNGDLLTKVDFGGLLAFHAEGGNAATICVREYDLQIPYGVIQMDGHHLKTIVEKPTHHFFINAGIYVLDPEVLAWVPRNKYYEMPALLEDVRKRRRRRVGCFPILEYWVDIGQMNDYERARSEYSKFF